MKHLLAILILTLVLAVSVHSYVLEARGSDGRLVARGPGGDNNNNNNNNNSNSNDDDDDDDHEDERDDHEDEHDECEPILGLLTSYIVADCLSDALSTSAIVLEEHDVCGGNPIVLDTCTALSTTTPVAVSHQLNRAYTDSIFCVLYTDAFCTIPFTTLRANDGDEAGTCVSPAVPILSVECFDNGDRDRDEDEDEH